MYCLLLGTFGLGFGFVFLFVVLFFYLGVSKAFCTDHSLLCFLPKAAIEGKGVCAVHLTRLLHGVTAEVWAVWLTISVSSCQ